jgi:hypothetical protein
MAIVLALLALVTLLLIVDRVRNARANRATIAALRASEAKTGAILKALPDFMRTTAAYLDYYAVGGLPQRPSCSSARHFTTSCRPKRRRPSSRSSAGSRTPASPRPSNTSC